MANEQMACKTLFLGQFDWRFSLEINKQFLEDYNGNIELIFSTWEGNILVKISIYNLPFLPRQVCRLPVCFARDFPFIRRNRADIYNEFVPPPINNNLLRNSIKAQIAYEKNFFPKIENVCLSLNNSSAAGPCLQEASRTNIKHYEIRSFKHDLKCRLGK